MDERGTRDGHADEAAGRDLSAEQAARPTTPSFRPTAAPSRPGRRVTSRCAATCSSRFPATLATMANGLPYSIGAAVAYPGPAGGVRRRRRRVHHADGRNGDAREIQAAGQGHRHQEQHARPDQVGADGLRGQPGVRRCYLQPIDFAAVAKACGAAGFTIERAEDAAGVL